ncbi:glycosyltransferase family 39 protein [Candidatus Eisenbacteria bacterium]|uniref:Glycosyltransferase family 39 protein n=1 Tax=Eiseniibacteriota bacterium TaxID=2212470 RepID=A0ABV6YPQ0_UNCEI
MQKPDTANRSRGWRSTVHRHGLFLACLPLSVYSVLAFVFFVRDHWVPGWDSAIYLLTARSLAAGTGYTYLGSAFYLRPPGFPWLLSLFVRDGGFNFHLLNLMIMAFAVAAVWVVFFIFRRRTGTGWALLIALLMGTSRLYALNVRWIMADFPCLLLLYSGLGLLDPAASGHRREWMLLLAGSLLLAASVYMRTAALVAAPGIIIVYFLKRRGWGRLAGVLSVLILTVLIAPWLYHAGQEAAMAERPSEQLMVFDYKTAVFHVNPGDPNSDMVSASMWRSRILGNVASLVRDGAYWIFGTRNRWVSYVLAAAVLLGLFVRLGRKVSMLDWFALLYVGVLLGYFTFARRLLLPAVPLAFAYILYALRFATRRAGHGSRWAPVLRGTVAVAAVGLLGLNILAATGWSDGTASGQAAENDKMVRMREDQRLIGDWLGKNTTGDATILAGPAPILSLLSGRNVYTYRVRSAQYVLEHRDIDFAVYAWWAPRWGEDKVIPRARSKWTLPSSLPGESISIYHLSESGLVPDAPAGESLRGRGRRPAGR